MGYITIDGKRIYFEAYGEDNQTVLLYLHGGPGASCLDFQRQARKLGQWFHVIATDQYGVLRSDAIPDDETYGMEKQIHLFEQMRVQLGVKSWSLLGHSYGGMLACLYADLFPGSIRTVIYECPCFCFSLSTKSVAVYLSGYFRDSQNPDGVQLCQEILHKVYEKNDKSAAEDMLHMLSLASGNPQVRNYLHNVSYEEYAASYSTDGISPEMWQKSDIHYEKLAQDGSMFSDFLCLIDTIRQPSLLLTGRYDPVCGEEQRRYFREHSPNGQMVEFEQSGHFPRIEEPEKYTNCVCRFLRNFAT